MIQLAKAKKSAGKRSLKDKMTVGYQKMEQERRAAIDKESPGGCKKA